MENSAPRSTLTRTRTLTRTLTLIGRRHDKATAEERMTRATHDLLLMLSSGLGDDLDQHNAQFAQELALGVESSKKKLKDLTARFPHVDPNDIQNVFEAAHHP